MLPSEDFFKDLEKVLAEFSDAERQRLRHMVNELDLMASRLPTVAEKCYAYQARLLAKLQEYPQALAAIDRAIALAPLDSQLIILRGDIYQEAQEYSRALRDYTEVLEANPEAVTARIRRADILMQTGDPAKALLDINEALKLEPRSVRLLYRRGLLLVEFRRVREAILDFKQVVQLSPDVDLRKKAEQRLRELGEA